MKHTLGLTVLGFLAVLVAATSTSRVDGSVIHSGSWADPCPADGRIPPSDETKSLVHDGVLRKYNVHVPPTYDAKSRTPLVLSMHGLDSNASEQERVSEMTAKSNTERFIVVYPEGLNSSWNGGECCPPSSTDNVDDVGFLRDMIQAISADLCIDEKRIYATGMSNGGYMAHRLACELGSTISAVASVAGPMGVTTCSPGRRVSVLQFHGTSDGIRFYSLGESAVSGWVTRNGCNASPTVTYSKGDSTCQTHACPEGAEVTFCTVQKGGHTWPGSSFPFKSWFGQTTQDLSATNAMWDFFEKHPMP